MEAIFRKHVVVICKQFSENMFHWCFIFKKSWKTHIIYMWRAVLRVFNAFLPAKKKITLPVVVLLSSTTVASTVLYVHYSPL